MRRIYYKLIGYLDFRARKENQAFQQLRARFYEELWRTTAENIHAHFDHWFANYHRISRDGLTTVVNLSRVMLDNHLLLNVIGNKKLTYELLSSKGLQTPKHITYDANTYQKGLDFLAEQASPVVVKPADGTGGGRGVTTGISTERQFRLASRLALRYSPTLLVETHAAGDSYRLLFLDGVFIDAIRRDSPCLTGDGRRTVRQLVAEENRKRLAGAPFRALSPLRIDRDSKQMLSAQGLTSKSVPEEGQRITVKQSVNENCAEENHNVRDQVHPGIVEMGSRLAADLGIRLSGLDMICTDISVPLEESGGIINEVNTTPGIHHHYLISNTDHCVPAAELILNYIFSRREGVLEL